MPYDPQLAKLTTIRTRVFNLETVLDFASSGKSTTKILEHIYQMIAQQFTFEEKTLRDLGFPLQQSHLDEHKTILEEIKQKESDWKKKAICGEIAAEAIKSRIFFHVRTLDQPFTDSIPHRSAT